MRMLAKTENLAALVQDWLTRFEQALGSEASLAALFHAESYWRDVLALTWRIKTVSGGESIADELRESAAPARPSGFVLASNRTPPRHVTRAGTQAVEAILS